MAVLTETAIIEIYDRILKKGDWFGINEIARSDSFKKTYCVINYTGAYRGLIAEYTEKFGYDVMNAFFKRISQLTSTFKPVKVVDPFECVSKKKPIIEKDEDTEEIDIGEINENIEFNENAGADLLNMIHG